eukprot:NODE_184_length_15718_cov_0.161342.p11 type:complete len:155 gc:universal NODE_184_length_15718_cov_0.161342:7640-8104(+)
MIQGATQLTMALFFIYAAVVQLNDPDYEIYLAMYLLSAVLAIGSTFDVESKLAGFSLYSISCFMLIHSFAKSSEASWYNFSTETGREQGGLTIITLWNLGHFLGVSGYLSMILGPAAITASVLVPVYLNFDLDTADNPEHCGGIGVSPNTFVFK